MNAMDIVVNQPLTFWTIDAFVDPHRPGSGNPADVCVVSDFPAKSIMQSIAAEKNLSETVFLKPLGPHHFHIRWFSPKDEAPLCGHATLAAAHVLFHQGYVVGDRIDFESCSGPLHVTRQGDILMMDFPARPIVSCDLPGAWNPMFNGMGIQAVARDHDIIMVHLSNGSDLIHFWPDHDLILTVPCRALLITAHGGPDDRKEMDFMSRYFAPRVGIFEDPVCGSAHCRMGPYWQGLLKRDRMMAYQASSEGGIIHVHVMGDRVVIGGAARPVGTPVSIAI